MSTRNKRHRLSDAFTPQKGMGKRSYITIAVIAFCAVGAIWSVLSYSGLVNNIFLPTPGATFDAGKTLFFDLNFFGDILWSMKRVFLGFLIAAVVAVPLGILIGTFAPIEAAVEPLVSFIRYMPATAFIPLFILWIGIGESEKVAVIILGSFPQLLLMVATNTRQVSHDLIEASYTLGTKKYQVLRKIIFPGAMPEILDSLRLVLGWAWTYVTVAEMVAASSGIGHITIQAQRTMQVGNIFVALVVIGLLGLIFDMCFRGLSKILFPWK